MVVFKDIFREIKGRWFQFLAIAIITMLGVGFYIGIQVTGHDMRITGDAYMQDSSVLDFQLRHSLGIDDEMIKAFREITGQRVYGISDTDSYVESEHFDDVVKVIEFDPNTEDDITIVEGRKPRKKGEVLVDAVMKDLYHMKLNDAIIMKSNELYEHQTLQIVGFIESSLFMNLERGQTRLGSGGVSGFIYPFTPERKEKEAFYTAARFVLEDNTDVKEVQEKIKHKEKTLSQERFERLIKPEKEKLQNAQTSLEEQKKDGYARFAIEKKRLDDANRLLTDTESELEMALLEFQMELPAGNLHDKWEVVKRNIDSEFVKQEGLILEAEEKLAKIPEGPTKDFAMGELIKQKEEFEFQKDFLYAQLNELKSGIDTFYQGQKDYETGLKAYQSAYKEFENKIAQGQREIDDGFAKIEKANRGKFYFFDREDVLIGYREFYDDSDRIEAIGKVFPLIFFGVSILVTLSTVSRMIDESRMQIGVYKALGYSPLFSALKYVGFTFLAWFMGSLLGVYFGFYFIPGLIYNAYRIMYLTPDLIEGIVWSYAWMPLLISFLASVGISFVKSMSVSRKKAAALLRPPMPKGGQRILLERIKPLWSRLSFLYKVSLRNLFRNKTRFLMTIAGIGGSFGLLIMGFGLRHSIYSIVDLQFDELTQYDGLVIFDEGYEIDQNLFDKVLNVNSKTIKAGKNDAYLYTAENVNDFKDFIVLRDRKTQKELEFGAEDVAISEKLALLMGIEEGDTLSFTYNDYDYEVQVDKIVENYAYHYVYMPQTVHDEIFPKKASCNQVFFKLDGSQEKKDELIETLYKDDEVLSVNFLENLRDTYRDMMGNFDIVIYVVVGAAIALEIVVLVNLITMNLSERYKEMATLKVLGFYPKELAAYLLRENIIMTLLSLVFGAFFGKYLHHFVIVNAEIDVVMFNRVLKMNNYLWGAAFTLIISIVVNLFMARKANNVNMSEALKTFGE